MPFFLSLGKANDLTFNLDTILRGSNFDVFLFLWVVVQNMNLTCSKTPEELHTGTNCRERGPNCSPREHTKTSGFFASLVSSHPQNRPYTVPSTVTFWFLGLLCMHSAGR